MVIISLTEFVQQNYPSDDASFMEKLVLSQPETWRDFTQLLLNHVIHPGINVYQSSTFAVCSEFLGNLDGSDLQYAQNRGGIWSCFNNNIVSVRDLLSILVVEYQ